MERDYAGVSPEEFTWNKLANAAGGKADSGSGRHFPQLPAVRAFQARGRGLEAVHCTSAFEALKDRQPHPEKVQLGSKYQFGIIYYTTGRSLMNNINK